MLIYHISDTHNQHAKITTPKNVDLLIHSGDAGVERKAKNSEIEIREFLKWFSSQNVKHKIYVPGNHDSSVEAGRITKEECLEMGIHLLINETVEVEGMKIWGSPYVPTFGDWSFMKARNNISEIWDQMDLEADVLVTHGPPYGILDLAVKNYRDSYGVSLLKYIEHVGCKSLLKKLKESNAKLHCFGHCHSKESCFNNGIFIHPEFNMMFSNASSLMDKPGERFRFTGNLITLGF